MMRARTQLLVEEDQSLFAKLAADEAGFQNLAAILRRTVGVHLAFSEKNLSLMAGRMSKIMNKHGCCSYSEFERLLSNPESEAFVEFVSVMTTHTTHFFREKEHFEILGRIFTDRFAGKQKPNDTSFTVWCAAASTGEEVWTLAMTLYEKLSVLHSPPKIRILGTDIDRNALQHALNAVYSEKQIEEVPNDYLNKYFSRGKGKSVGMVRVKNFLRELVTFAEFNLLTEKYPFRTQFDIIFCRNVLIYFDDKDVMSTLTKLEGCLADGGHLFLGHSEAVVRFKSKGLVRNAPAVYRREPCGGGTK